MQRKKYPEKIDYKVEYNLLTNILASADYSNYPTTDDHGIYDNIEIITGTTNEAFQFKKQHIVARVIQNMEVNVITASLKEEELQLDNITPLTQEQLEENNRTLLTIMNRSSETMYEVLTNMNVFYNLFYPLGTRYNETAKHFITKHKGLIGQEIVGGENFKIIASILEAIDLSIGVYHINKYKNEIHKALMKPLFLVQNEMRLRIHRQNWWLRNQPAPLSRYHDDDFNAAFALSITSMYVKKIIDPAVYYLKTELWPYNRLVGSVTAPAKWNEWCRVSFDYYFIDTQLHLGAELESHALQAVVSKEYKDFLFSKYTTKMVNALNSKPLQLHNLQQVTSDEEIKNITSRDDFIEETLIKIGFDKEKHYNRYIPLFIEDKDIKIRRPQKDNSLPYTDIIEPFIDILSNIDNIDVLMESDFYVFYLFYRVLAKAQNDPVLKALAYEGILLQQFDVFESFQQYLYANILDMDMQDKTVLITNILTASPIYENPLLVVTNNITSPVDRGVYQVQSYNPLLTLPRLTMNDKNIIIKHAFGLLIKYGRKAADYEKDAQQFIEGKWKVDTTMHIGTLFNLLSGNLVNSNNRFLSPSFMLNEKPRTGYSKCVSLYLLSREIDRTQLEIDNLENNIAISKDSNIIKRLPTTLDLHMSIQLKNDYTLFEPDRGKDWKNNENIECFWLWSPSRDELGRSFVVAYNKDTIFKNDEKGNVRSSLHTLHIDLADGLEGTYTFVCGSVNRGFISKSVGVRIQQKCVRTGRWFEEEVDNAQWGAMTWCVKNPYVMRGWYSATTTVPYASHIPENFKMYAYVNTYVYKQWTDCLGDVPAHMCGLTDMIYNERRMWSRLPMFQTIDKATDLLRFLFLFIVSNLYPKLDPITGTPEDGHTFFKNSLIFATYYERATVRRRTSMQEHRVLSQLIAVCNNYIKNNHIPKSTYDFLVSMINNFASTGADIQLLRVSKAAKQVIIAAKIAIERTAYVEDKSVETLIDDFADLDLSDVDELFEKEQQQETVTPTKRRVVDKTQLIIPTTENLNNNNNNLRSKMPAPFHPIVRLDDAVASLETAITNTKDIKDLSLSANEHALLAQKLQMAINTVKTTLEYENNKDVNEYDELLKEAQQLHR